MYQAQTGLEHIWSVGDKMNVCKMVALLGVVANASLGANALGIREDAALTVASAVDMLAGVDASAGQVAVDANADPEVGAGCGLTSTFLVCNCNVCVSGGIVYELSLNL